MSSWNPLSDLVGRSVRRWPLIGDADAQVGGFPVSSPVRASWPATTVFPPHMRRRGGFSEDIPDAIAPRRFLPAVHPHNSAFTGRSVRRGGVAEDHVKVEPKRRITPGHPPHPSDLRGRSSRRLGAPPPPAYPIRFISRFRKWTPPHPSDLEGRFLRRNGVDEDEVHIISKHRFLYGKPAHPSDLRAHHVRRPGYSEDLEDPVFQPWYKRTAPGHPPHPSDLGARHTRRPGSSEDISPPIWSRELYTRHLPGQPLHPSDLSGRSVRRGGVSEDDIGIPRHRLRRVLPAQPTHPSDLDGQHLRRSGVAEDFIHIISKHRFLYGKRPHPSDQLGSHRRREGVSEDIFPTRPPRLFHRFRRHTPPHVSDVRGHHLRRPGISENIEPPVFQPWYNRTAPGHPPHPSDLDGRSLRRPGYSEDISDPVFQPWYNRFLRAKYPNLIDINGRHSRRIFLSPGFVEFFQTYQQGFRVADDSLDRYQLFVGIDGPPNFADDPVAESATLPFSWSPPVPSSGSTVFHCVVRRVNAYGLQSFNIEEWLIEIDSGGASVRIDPSAPVDVTVRDWDSGYVRVFARYLYGEDQDPANTWQIFVDTGVDPDPERSSGPDLEQDMVVLGSEAGINATVGPFTPGTTVHVIVVARRSDDNAYGAASAVQHTLIESIDLDDGMLFGGSVYEQR